MFKQVFERLLRQREEKPSIDTVEKVDDHVNVSSVSDLVFTEREDQLLKDLGMKKEFHSILEKLSITQVISYLQKDLQKTEWHRGFIHSLRSLQTLTKDKAGLLKKERFDPRTGDKIDL